MTIDCLTLSKFKIKVKLFVHAIKSRLNIYYLLRSNISVGVVKK